MFYLDVVTSVVFFVLFFLLEMESKTLPVVVKEWQNERMSDPIKNWIAITCALRYMLDNTVLFAEVCFSCLGGSCSKQCNEAASNALLSEVTS